MKEQDPLRSTDMSEQEPPRSTNMSEQEPPRSTYMSPQEPLDQLELELDYRFADRALLEKALIHSSHAHERGLQDDNEQLEFLGDSILGFLVSDLLCREYPT